MIRTSLRAALTAEEQRFVRNWTVGVLLFYGVALTALGVVSLGLHATESASQSAATDPTTTVAAKAQRTR
jgi:hypothetical protein